MKIRILDAAQQDLVNGFRFYEVQENGLGSYFLDSLYADIDSLMFFGGVHMVVAGSYHRMLAKRFPFCRLLPDGECQRSCLCSSRLSSQPCMEQKTAAYRYGRWHLILGLYGTFR